MLSGADLMEVWYAHGAVVSGVDGAIRHAADEHFLSAVIEVDEREHGGIMAATAFAYRSIARFQANSGFPHLLRTWNYFDAINRGEGDSERYREFCSGRVAGFDGKSQAHFRQPQSSAGATATQVAGVLARGTIPWYRAGESSATLRVSLPARVR